MSKGFRLPPVSIDLDNGGRQTTVTVRTWPAGAVLGRAQDADPARALGRAILVAVIRQAARRPDDPGMPWAEYQEPGG